MSRQNDLGVAPIQFNKDETYTTFSAEYGFDGDDIVFHFFRSPERGDNKYWKETFPHALSDTAIEHFKVSYPRLKACFTEEVDSWWLRAYGFAHIGDPDERCKRFFAKLDKALDHQA